MQLFTHAFDKTSTYGLNLNHYFDLPCHVYLKGIDGKYLKCNDMQAQSFGLEKGTDVVGKDDSDFFCRKDVKIIRTNDQEIIKKKTSKLVVEPVAFINNRAIVMLSFKTALTDSANNVVGLLGTSVPMGTPLATAINSLQPAKVDQYVLPVIMAQEKLKKISKRETQCLNYLLHGMSSKEIARVLNLSPRTIEFYIENMKTKFQCNNRLELVAKAEDIFKTAENAVQSES